MSVASSLASMDLLVSLVCAAIVFASVHTIIKGNMSRSALNQAVGLAMFAGGIGLQVTYWAVNRSLEALGHECLRAEEYVSLSWFMLIPLLIAITGGGLLLGPILEVAHGRYWLHKYLAVVIMVWAGVSIIL